MKRILVIATGGTIASSAGTTGLAPAVSGDDLVAAVPQLAYLCHVDVVQPMNIDSTNMRPSDWLRIAREIVRSYDGYDGFVVMHGTDTMAYTAAALSYLVQGGGKPIVLTGSQQPMAHPFTDAKLNLYQSVLYACDEGSGGVCVVFGGEVIAGTRARKQRTLSFNAFSSVNFPELAVIRGGRIVRPRLAAPDGAGPLQAYDALDERVAVLKLTPGLRPELFDLLREGYRAIVLETFGVGGVPASLKGALFGWVDSGRTLVITTQVPEEGLDLGVYEVGRAYKEKEGILEGADMTLEALVAKTMWALAASDGPADMERIFYQPVNYDRTPRA